MTTGGMETPGIDRRRGEHDLRLGQRGMGGVLVQPPQPRRAGVDGALVVRGGGRQQRGDQAQLAGEAGPALEVLVGPVDPGVRVGLEHRVSTASGDASVTSVAKSSAGSATLASSHPVKARTRPVEASSSSSNTARICSPARSPWVGVGANRQSDTSSSAASQRASSPVGTWPVAAARSSSESRRVR